MCAHTCTHTHTPYFSLTIWSFDLIGYVFKPYDSETFENSSNSVELRLHLAPSYRLKNGALQPMYIDQDGVTPLSFDRRKTVGDLRLSVYQV